MAPSKLLGIIVLTALVGGGVPLLLFKFFGPESEAQKTAEVEPVRAPVVKEQSLPYSGNVEPLRRQPWVWDDEPERVVWVQGVLRRGADVLVILSDGRRLDGSDRHLQRIDRLGVIVSGLRIYYRPYTRPPVEDDVKPEGSGELKSDNALTQLIGG